MTSPCAASTSATGLCANHSIRRSGTCSRNARAIARSRRTWPSPIGEHTHNARRVRSRANNHVLRAALAGAACMSTNSLIRRLTTSGMPPVRQVPRALEDDEPRARDDVGEAAAPLERLAPVLGAVDDEHRAGDRPGELDRLVLGRRVQRGVGASGEHVDVGLMGPPDEIVEDLGGVGFGQQDIGVVADPAVEPALPRLRVDGVDRVRVRSERVDTGRDRHDAANPCGAVAASSSDHLMPEHNATRNAASVPVASSTASASRAYTSSP